MSTRLSVLAVRTETSINIQLCSGFTVSLEREMKVRTKSETTKESKSNGSKEARGGNHCKRSKCGLAKTQHRDPLHDAFSARLLCQAEIEGEGRVFLVANVVLAAVHHKQDEGCPRIKGGHSRKIPCNSSINRSTNRSSLTPMSN